MLLLGSLASCFASNVILEKSVVFAAVVQPTSLILVLLLTAKGSDSVSPRRKLWFLITVSTYGLSASAFPPWRENPWKRAAKSPFRKFEGGKAGNQCLCVVYNVLGNVYSWFFLNVTRILLGKS